MFYLYQSNRLESLAVLFAGIQRVRPLESALAAEQIVVQSQGMRRYLSVYLARLEANLARIEALIAVQEARSSTGEDERIEALEARISKLEKRLAKSK